MFNVGPAELVVLMVAVAIVAAGVVGLLASQRSTR